MATISTLLDYYRKKEDEDRNIIFEKVKEKDIKICSHPLEDVIVILTALDIERKYEIKMTMENLKKYQELYLKATREGLEDQFRLLLEKGE